MKISVFDTQSRYDTTICNVQDKKLRILSVFKVAWDDCM